jgi:hypothetical protein
MICAACGEETAEDRCVACGGEARLAGRYRLVEVIGRGTAATTWRALADGAPFAIKEMPLHGSDSTKARELLAREVRVLRELRHPQIPRYVDDLVTGKGRGRAMWLVQEMIEGEDLAAQTLHHRWTESEILGILEGILPVFVYLHGLAPPVIHRDVKPRNIVRRASDGALVLVDFGSVRDAVRDPALGGSTVAGTFGYMAPEQFQGIAAPGSDLYGLGALCVALLCRREPHTMLDHHGVIQWRAHANVRPAVEMLLARLLEPALPRRPSSAAAVLAEVTALRAAMDRFVDPFAPAALPAADDDTEDGAGPAPPVEPPSPFVPGAPEGFLTETGASPEVEGERKPTRVVRAAPVFRDPPTDSEGTDPRGRPNTLLFGMLLVAFIPIGMAAGMLIFVIVALVDPSLVPRRNAGVAGMCVASRHDSQGAAADAVNGYQFLAGTPAGDRLAVLFTKDAGASLAVYTAGDRDQGKPRHIAGPEDTESWDEYVERVRAAEAPALEAAGLRTSILPIPLSWCQVGQRVRIEKASWTWSTWQEPCANGEGMATQWQLCPEGSHVGCIEAPKLAVACWSEEPRLVDLYAVGDTLWVVAERPRADGTPRMLAGGPLHP